MTLAAMWIETRDPDIPDAGRLCFASDSRTSPGPIEGVAKVLLFSRPDIAAVWAGDFRYAALLANHLDVALSATAQMRDRAVDLGRLFRMTSERVVAHLESTTITSVFAAIPQAQEPERMTMLVGGYSIVEARYIAMRINWDPSRLAWRCAVKPVNPSQISFIGDASYVSRARWLVKKIRRHRPNSEGDWHMEPLAAIDHYRRDADAPTIGGDLQLAKAFVHGAALAYAIRQPLDKEISVRGSRFRGVIAEDYKTQKLLVDMSRWSLPQAAFGPLRNASAATK
jgi:hypothetical protein